MLYSIHDMREAGVDLFGADLFDSGAYDKAAYWLEDDFSYLNILCAGYLDDYAEYAFFITENESPDIWAGSTILDRAPYVFVVAPSDVLGNASVFFYLEDSSVRFYPVEDLDDIADIYRDLEV